MSAPPRRLTPPGWLGNTYWPGSPAPRHVADLYHWAAAQRQRIVTENIKDLRPLLVRAYATTEPVAQLLLVHPRRFARGSGGRSQVIIDALTAWLNRPGAAARPDEDWLTESKA